MTHQAQVRNRLLIITVALTLIFLIVMLPWLWPTDMDPQGGAGFWCDNENIVSSSNISGWTVSGHNTVCSGFGGNSAIYIYVHPVGQAESREFLAFRYSEYGGASLPKIEWTGENRLSIHVEKVSQITKMIPSIGPVRISYKIDREEHPQSMK